MGSVNQSLLWRFRTVSRPRGGDNGERMVAVLARLVLLPPGRLPSSNSSGTSIRCTGAAWFPCGDSPAARNGNWLRRNHLRIRMTNK
jgi:hypothetical protein